ncbi:transposase [Thermopolyspora sp. NPDC052614]|uniref:transposase n=1 Tax=Thermopolyspora sp. NPDC052614 TaxID=3155682 RepID=UPI003423A446
MGDRFLGEGRKSFGETDYAALPDAAHQRLGGAIVVCRDNLNTHISARMRALIDARPWLTIIRLPAYAPELNPVEAVKAHLKCPLTNLAKKDARRARPAGQDTAEKGGVPPPAHQRLPRQALRRLQPP